MNHYTTQLENIYNPEINFYSSEGRIEEIETSIEIPPTISPQTTIESILQENEN